MKKRNFLSVTMAFMLAACLLLPVTAFAENSESDILNEQDIIEDSDGETMDEQDNIENSDGETMDEQDIIEKSDESDNSDDMTEGEAPVITKQPNNSYETTKGDESTAITITIEAAGTPDLKYQWQGLVDGEWKNSIVFMPVYRCFFPEDYPDDQAIVRCVVSNEFGEAISDEVVINIIGGAENDGAGSDIGEAENDDSKDDKDKSEKDDLPKTADSTVSLWIAAAALILAGVLAIVYAAKSKARN